MALDRITVTPLSEHLGAELHHVAFESLAPTEAFVDVIRKLLARHLVLLIRGQTIQPQTMQAFSANFGPLRDIKRQGGVQGIHVPEAFFIKVNTNGTNEAGIPLGDGSNVRQTWHSDSTASEAPIGHISFYCRKAPRPAPKTHFMNMIKVYEALPESMKERIAKIRAIHYFFPHQIEPEIADTLPPFTVEQRRFGALHPLVRRHLPTGKPFLFLPTRRDSLIPGLSETESMALLTELWDLAAASPFQISHAMEPDDFVFWDNSATVHGRDGWPASQTRVMWHISSEGEVPIPYFPKRTLNTIGLSSDEARSANADLVMLDY